MIEVIRAHLKRAAGLAAQAAECLAEPASQAAQAIVDAVRDGHVVYVCGDGGSAAQAQHLAGELVGRFLIDRPALPCVALTTDTSVLTAVANDFDFEQVFERQAEALIREGDVLIALSTSGESVNVLKAAALARGRGAKVIALTGQGGGRLGELCDVALLAPAAASPLIQEIHLVVLHALCGAVEQALFARGAEDAPKDEE